VVSPEVTSTVATALLASNETETVAVIAVDEVPAVAEIVSVTPLVPASV